MKNYVVLSLLFMCCTGGSQPSVGPYTPPAEALRRALHPTPSTRTLGKQLQPLMDFVISQAYNTTRYTLSKREVTKNSIHQQTTDSMLFVDAIRTNTFCVNIVYLHSAERAQNTLFEHMALSSAPISLIIAGSVVVSNGPGELCIASDPPRQVLFVRGNAFVRILNVEGATDGLLDVARWLDAEFARLSTNAAALKAADPCETNETPYAKFIVYDCPEPEVEPLPSTAE